MRSDLAWTGDGLQIHFLDNGGRGLPLLFVADTFARAEDAADFLKQILPRRALAFSARGVGRSQALEAGQAAFECRVLDLEAVASAANLKEHIVYACGGSCALAAAYAHARGPQVRALIFQDGLPAAPALSSEWRAEAMRAKMSGAAADIYVADSEAVDVTDWLIKLHFPVLILTGSHVDAATAEALRARLPHAEVAEAGLQNVVRFCKAIPETASTSCC
jgi:pimeloyl-ACP methyl ester carboxylesterase